MVMATQELKACELKVDEGDGTKIVVPEIKADLDKFAGMRNITTLGLTWFCSFAFKAFYRGFIPAGRVKLSLALELGNAGEIAGLVDLDIVEHAGFLHDVDWIGNTGGERLVVAGGQLPEIRCGNTSVPSACLVTRNDEAALSTIPCQPVCTLCPPGFSSPPLCSRRLSLLAGPSPLEFLLVPSLSCYVPVSLSSVFPQGERSFPLR